jgi:proteasome lid subunit RPN8/RPN11
MPQLLIAPEDLQKVEAQALAAFPAECCGLLLGRAADGGRVSIGWVEPCVNEAPDRRCRFTISPGALLVAYRWARDRGEQVVGTYHSHPRGAAVPSEIDRQSAWPGASCLIVGLGEEGVRERRSWRLERERFVEEEMIARAGEDGEEP